MEIVINRIKYEIPEHTNLSLILSKEDNLPFSMQFQYFKERCQDDVLLLDEWSKQNNIQDANYISYGFYVEGTHDLIEVPYNSKFIYNYTIWLLSQHFLKKGFFVNVKSKGLSLSCYEFQKGHNKDWNIYRRWDFVFETNSKTLVFNIGSTCTFISTNRLEVKSEYNFTSVVHEDAYIRRSNTDTEQKFKIVANKTIKDIYLLESSTVSINYTQRYKDLLSFFNKYLKPSNEVTFLSVGFDSLKANTVSFEKNTMLFKNGKTDINVVTGMRNLGVYKDAPNAIDKQFIFIYQNNDDANTLFKYLKNGHKGFPGLQPYVNIPLTLANSVVAGKYKRLQYSNIENIIEEYKDFESVELPDSYYDNLFAIIIGPFDKSKPRKEYYDLKLDLIKKGIPSQFLNYENIRKAGVFNYHLPNIAIGIHAKMGGIPWRLNTEYKKELIIGFNQIKTEQGKFIGSTVFFDNQGRLKRSYAFGEQNSPNEIISLLKNAIESFLTQENEIQRLIIHYHKTLSKKEHGNIDRILREEFNLSIPFAVVEINDTKSRLEIGFDPNNNFMMPVSGGYVRLTKKDYLLFNNNRFDEITLLRIKDELPLKIKIHFADEAGFSHKELIEQVYEFSRLIWKGLKQRSQPATCYYAKEIARFKSEINEPIPDNLLTQTTPWVI